MAVVPLTCPRCSGPIEIDASRASQQAVCPACHGLITVPPAELLTEETPPQPEVVPPPIELLSLVCPTCHVPFQVGMTLAGHRVACPNCRELVSAPPPIATSNPVSVITEPAAPPVQSRPQSTPAQRVLSPRERAQRRFTRNLVLWIVCLAILVAALVLLS